MSKTTCSVEGCGLPHKARSFCGMHYARWRRLGDPGLAEQINLPRGVDCIIDGCGRPQKAKGFCGSHWARNYRHGDPGTAEMFTPREGCEIADCDRPHVARGLCGTHHQRWRKHGDPQRVDPARWFGDEVGYIGAHQRIYKLRGRAAEHACELCGRPADEWSYDHADPNERMDEQLGPYSIDPKHYRPLCLSCHRTFDASKEERPMCIPVENITVP